MTLSASTLATLEQARQALLLERARIDEIIDALAVVLHGSGTPVTAPVSRPTQPHPVAAPDSRPVESPQRDAPRVNKQQSAGVEYVVGGKTWLREVRKAAGITSAKASELLGRPRQWWSNRENGNVGLTVTDQAAIVQALGLGAPSAAEVSSESRSPPAVDPMDHVGLVGLVLKSMRLPVNEDTMQMGMLGVVEAARRFDPSLGFKFTTYAVHHVRQKIRTGTLLGRHVYVPQKYWWDARGHLAKPVELDADFKTSGDAEGRVPVPQLGGEDRRFTDVENAQEVERLLSVLDARERKIIELRFGLRGDADEETTLKGIGREMGLSRERIRQLEAQAMEKLRRVAAVQQKTRTSRRGSGEHA